MSPGSILVAATLFVAFWLFFLTVTSFSAVMLTEMRGLASAADEKSNAASTTINETCLRMLASLTGVLPLLVFRLLDSYPVDDGEIRPVAVHGSNHGDTPVGDVGVVADRRPPAFGTGRIGPCG